MRIFWILAIFLGWFLVFGAQELVFAQVFYRHGETAFTENGEKLTPEGQIYTQKLGDFLQNRYSDFLANITFPEQYFQMLWTYENSQKCLESAKIVASRVLPNLPVALTSNPKILEIFNPKFNKCPIEQKWFEEICPGAEFKRIFENHDSYYSAISMCLSISKPETFRKIRFQDMESWLKRQLRNNSGHPHFEWISSDFYSMNQKMNGVQKGFEEGELMKIRYGKILGFLAENLKKCLGAEELDEISGDFGGRLDFDGPSGSVSNLRKSRIRKIARFQHNANH
ncbi:unnamed protein product [Caenorhabditis angaria]|uniref:Uncharacterized protein n=1 Tax=Caenorhabditis angaria TaxID=860376 RepID=A0A9P1MXJ5_9PELO|nr:unnamed protein product [Caenorhabditis angaria]